jgi:hypothetical protein
MPLPRLKYDASSRLRQTHLEISSLLSQNVISYQYLRAQGNVLPTARTATTNMLRPGYAIAKIWNHFSGVACSFSGCHSKVALRHFQITIETNFGTKSWMRTFDYRKRAARWLARLRAHAIHLMTPNPQPYGLTSLRSLPSPIFPRFGLAGVTAC